MKDELVGRTLGEFVIRDRIGEGGFGVVYRATQAGLEREAVLKVMSRRDADSATTRRFLREAKLASRLDHPYAAHIYAFGAEPDGVLWIAMELVRGAPLDRLLATQGAIPVERFLPLLERICEVVHTAHEAGIVHRDLKPANVMVLARAGRYLPKLLDFGIAKSLDVAGGNVGVLPTSPQDLGEARTEAGTDVGAPGLTRRGAVMGSPLYMAPEQWMDAASVDARTDQYALGVLAYECLAGKPPFVGATLNQIAIAHASAPLPPLGAGFPSALDAVLARAVAKQASERFPSVLELASAFREASGIAADAQTLPQLHETVRETAIATAVQPIAEAVAALEAARNAHQGRDALFALVKTTVRYVGLLALAARSRLGPPSTDPPRVVELVRTLYKRSLSDEEWLELARAIVQPFRERTDTHPVPELVELLDCDAFDRLFARRETSAANPLDVLAGGVVEMTALLRACEPLWAYPLVVSMVGGTAERWMGVRRASRATVAIAGRSLPERDVALLDRQHVPVLSLAPLFQVTPPNPGAPHELFLFEGRGHAALGAVRRGAKLAALPSAFEHHDETLWEWLRGTLLATTFDETEGRESEERPPYLGLATFAPADAANYFGREALVDAFANRLRAMPLLAVVGGSGAGKSSFVQAGVIPTLGWRALTMRPGPSPMAALAASLQRAGIEGTEIGEAVRSDALVRGPLLLVIDQLEELFTLCTDPDERIEFATTITRVARSADDPVRVIVTVRDDFLVRAEALAPFRSRLGTALQLLTVPAVDDLLRTLVEPARRAGYEFEDAALPLEMVKAVADQPSALPLLSFTASKLWDQRDRHFQQLTRKAYAAIGGVGGALAQHAESTIDAMTADEQRLVREAFRHLVTAAGTRAVLSRTELLQLVGEGPGSRAIEKLVGARLLSVTDAPDGAARVEIVHEALLVTWPRLVAWTREDVESSRMRDQLRAAARQWDERKRSRGLLWRGDALADYERWRNRHAGSLTETEAAFAAASVAEARRGKRIRVGFIALAFVGLAIAIAMLARSNARTQSKVAQLYEEQGRQHYLAGDSLRASVYLVAAKRAGASGAAVDFLLGRTLSGLDREQHQLVGHQGPIVSMAYDRAGRRLLTAGYDGTIRIWNAATGASERTLAGHAPLWLHARFSPDETRIASGGDDRSVRLWNAADGALLHTWTDHPKSVEVVQFGRVHPRLLSASVDGTVIVRDAATYATIARWQTNALRDASFDPAETSIWVVNDDGAVTIRDVQGEQATTLATTAIPTVGVAFDPTGKFAVTGESNALALWNAQTRVRVATLPLGNAHRSPIRAARPAFSADGTRLGVITVSGIEVWALVDVPRRLFVLPVHRGETAELAFSPDGKQLASAGGDGTVRVWSLAGGALDATLDALESITVVAYAPDGQLAAGALGRAIVWQPRSDLDTRAVTKPDRIRVARFSPDGARIAATAADNTLEIYDARTLQLVRRTEIAEQLYLDWDSSGAWLVTGGGGGVAYRWDAATLARVRAFGGHRGEIRGIDLSRDGTRLATADEAGKVRIWDAASGSLLQTIDAHTLFPTMVAFDPSGRRLASSGRDRAVRIWNVETGEKLDELAFDNWAMSVAFDDAGRQLLVAAGRTASIWDLASRRQLVMMDDHQREIRYAQFGAGGLVTTSSFDSTAKVWDARSGRLLGTFARHHKWLRWGELDPTGTRLVTSSDDHSFIVWELPREVRSAETLSHIVDRRVPYMLRDEILVRRRE